MPINRDSKGRFVKKDQPMTVETENVRNYVVPVPNFFMWPIHVGAWLVATIVRGVVLVLILCVLVALYGAWQGDPDSCPVAPAPSAYVAPIST